MLVDRRRDRVLCAKIDHRHAAAALAATARYVAPSPINAGMPLAVVVLVDDALCCPAVGVADAGGDYVLSLVVAVSVVVVGTRIDRCCYRELWHTDAVAEDAQSLVATAVVLGRDVSLVCTLANPNVAGAAVAAVPYLLHPAAGAAVVRCDSYTRTVMVAAIPRDAFADLATPISSASVADDRKFPEL